MTDTCKLRRKRRKHRPVNFTQEQVTTFAQTIHEVVHNRTELLSEYH
jgi:hypothetical protein